jgi:hemolysin III
MLSPSLDALQTLQNSVVTAVDGMITVPVVEVAHRLVRVMMRPAEASRSAHEKEQEEQLSAITHGIGFVLSAAATAYLLTFVFTLGGSLRLGSCGVYGVSLVMMYAASTALHATRRPELKRRFQLYDHISIYVLIAGTYTPFLAVLLHGYLGFSMLACVWALAAFGIAIKLKNANRLAETSPLPCLGLGWLVLAVIKPLMAVLPASGIALLVAGGVSYSIGMMFFCRDDKRYFHAVWHLFVIAGTAFHFAAILIYVAI